MSNNSENIGITIENLQHFKDNCDNVYLQDAPTDGQNYVRNNGEWVTLSSGGTGNLNNVSFYTLLYNTVTEDTIDDIFKDDYLKNIVFDDYICIKKIFENENLYNRVSEHIFNHRSAYSKYKIYNILLKDLSFFKKFVDNKNQLSYSDCKYMFDSYDIMQFLLDDGLVNGEYYNYVMSWKNYGSYSSDSDYAFESFYRSFYYTYIVLSNVAKYMSKYKLRRFYKAGHTSSGYYLEPTKQLVQEKDMVVTSWADMHTTHDLNSTEYLYMCDRFTVTNEGSGENNKEIDYTVKQGYDDFEVCGTWEYCPGDFKISSYYLCYGGVKLDAYFYDPKEYDNDYYITFNFEKYKIIPNDNYKLIKNDFGQNEIVLDETKTNNISLLGQEVNDNTNEPEIIISEENLKRFNEKNIDIYSRLTTEYLNTKGSSDTHNETEQVEEQSTDEVSKTAESK